MSSSYSNTACAAFATYSDPLWDMGGTSDALVAQSTHQELISAHEYLPAGSDLPNLDTANEAASALATTTGVEAFTNLITQQDYMYLDIPNPWSMPTQPLFDASSVVSQPVGNTYWTGLATLPVVETPDVASPRSPTGLHASQDERTWLSEPGQSTYSTPTSSSGNGGEAGLFLPESGMNPFGVTAPPTEWGTKRHSWPTPTFAPTMALGNCRREAEEPQSDWGPVATESNQMPPKKRVKGRASDGVRKTARSVAKTCHKPVARTPKTRISNKPKEVGHGAERLTTLNIPGIYHQSLTGPSFQQGWAVEDVDGQLIWVEERAGEEVMGQIDRTAQQTQQQQQEGTTNELFKIPQEFEPAGLRALLLATEAEWTRGAVQEIKCSLCPDIELKKWGDFRRHGMYSEVHPLKIHICGHCGDYFARPDSLGRHCNQRPPECRSATPMKAAMKRRVTQNAHEEFLGELERGEGIEASFLEIMKEKFPDSSKKQPRGKKEQSRPNGR